MEILQSEGMNETIQWPAGEFTIQAAVELNRALPEAAVREQLARAIAAKAVVQTTKGDRKTKGKFQAVKPAQP
jgi:plasmid replication initiation protein